MVLFAGWKLHLYQKEITLKKEREKAQERELEHQKKRISLYKLGTAHENFNPPRHNSSNRKNGKPENLPRHSHRFKTLNFVKTL